MTLRGVIKMFVNVLSLLENSGKLSVNKAQCHLEVFDISIHINLIKLNKKDTKWRLILVNERTYSADVFNIQKHRFYGSYYLKH